MPQPGPNEVLIRVEASPINPSDIGLLFGAADLSKAEFLGRGTEASVKAPVPERLRLSMAGRLGQSMPCGNEGAGTVVAAGASDTAQALLGKKVAVIGGGMYSQYRCLPAEQCLVLPDNATAEQGASCFVNPLTALGFVETMRREGHQAMVHTAAASNLGQMLVRICLKDGIPLVNVVRSATQASLLRSLGATHVVDSSLTSFSQDLAQACAETGATLGFDATGGGALAGQILQAMESALLAKEAKAGLPYSRYGSATLKKVYLYGTLDTGPTQFARSFGFAWSMGGWLLFPFLAQCGAETAARLKARVAAELTTTFASHYSATISLPGMLQETAVRAYYARKTGAKYLLNPQLP
jgi:NADPH:quinone reductase